MDKKELLLEYLKINIGPILEDILFGSDIEDSVILLSNISRDELTGHYEGINYVPPKWFDELKNKKILVIDNIDLMDKEEQIKFIEIIKYRKISTFEIDKDIRIIVTAKNINKNTINSEIYSLSINI